MFEIFRSGLSFLSNLTVNFAHLGVIICVVSYLIIFIAEILIKTFSKIKRDTIYFLCYSIISALFTAYFSIEDFFNQKLLFETPKSVYLFMTILLSLSLIFYALLNAFKKKNSETKIQNEEVFSVKTDCKSKEVIEITPNLTDYNEGGYLDVSYVKSLIQKLKEKNLSQEDYALVEDFELYLLNFVSRQPVGEERSVLSEKISMLIKKLAFYAIC